MDLIVLQNQLKVAIQNHQITVARMKGEPQNSGLHKQLQDLQMEIMSLSEKQKQVVQQLRKELEKKQAAVGVGSLAGSITTTSTHNITTAVAPRLVLSAAAQTALHLHRPTLTVPPFPLGTSNKSSSPTGSVAANFASSPAAQHIIRQVVPSLVNNLVAAATGNVAFKTPIAAAVLLPPGTTNAVFAAATPSAKGAENKTPVTSPQQAPVLVVPSPALRSSESSPSSSSLLVNLAPPIRVPQYPPPISKAPTSQSSSPSVSSPVSSTSVPAADLKDRRPVTSTHNSSSTKVASPTVSRATSKPKQAEELKMNFLTSLGLVTKAALNELQNKRVERKRRTTANPHFSNAAVEERRKHAAAAALLQQAAAPHHHNRFHGPFKRPRGRPRLNQMTPGSSRPSTPESPVSPSARDSPPATAVVHTLQPLPPPQQLVTSQPSTINILPLSSISPPATILGVKGLPTSSHHGTLPTLTPLNSQTVFALSGLPQVLNGCLKPLAIRNGVAGERSCCVCGLLVLMRLPTDGSTCSQCKAMAHVHCAALGTKDSNHHYPGKPWKCQKCSKSDLMGKEEKRQQLLKRRHELTTEQGHLKEKLKQLGQVAMSQQKRHKELMVIQNRTQTDVKRILDVVNVVRQCSPEPPTAVGVSDS